MAKKKTVKSLPSNQQIAAVPPPVVPVALLIDGENIIAPDLVAHLLVEAGKMGGVTIRRVYGNWSALSMQPWKKSMTLHAIEPRSNLSTKSGHNATDIALVIGAMDLLYQGIRHFCLVAGDSDYVPLVLRLRQEGCIVLVVGTSSVAADLKEASSKFLSTEQLVPPQVAVSPPKAALPSALTTAQTTSLTDLLTDAYRAAAQGDETKWVLLAPLGVALRQLAPDFQKTYGKQNLTTMVEKYPKLFEIRQRESGNGSVGEVRLRQHPHKKQ